DQHPDRARLQGRRPLPRRLRPQGDQPRRARDARPDGPAHRVRRPAAAGRRPHRRLAAHDRADRRPHRDADRAGRRRPLGQLQHLLHPGPRRRRDRRRRRHRRAAHRRPGLRLEGRVAAGVLVGDPAALRVPRRAGRGRRPEHGPGRRRRPHAAGAPRYPLRGRGRRPGHHGVRLRGVRGHPRRPPREPGPGPAVLDPHRPGHHGRHRGDHHRRHAPVRAGPRRPAAVPGDQRQRLGDQEQVRQPLRLPPLAGRRPEPRHRRDDRRQGRGRLRLRRRGQGLRRGAARPGRPRDRHRDRPDLRPAGGDARLRGDHPRRGHRQGRHHHHGHRQQGHHQRRAARPDEAPGDHRQHRALRQRDRRGRPGQDPRHHPDDDQAAGGRVAVRRRPHDHPAVRGPAAEPRQRHRSPELRHERLVRQPGARADRA
ncbi:MAG: Adenosylhomocysteinase, partial [uncultured Friedmanniella sp.]